MVCQNFTFESRYPDLYNEKLAEKILAKKALDSAVKICDLVKNFVNDIT